MMKVLRCCLPPPARPGLRPFRLRGPCVSVLAWALLLPAAAIRAQDQSDLLWDGWQHFGEVWRTGQSGYALDIDNDSLLLRDKDGLYTSGAQIRIFSFTGDDKQTRMAGWRLGHQMYTPTDIKIQPSQLRAFEHPYAAWLYTGWYAQRHEADGAYLKTGIDIGCIGPCAGGEHVQNGLHAILNQPKPVGWGSQVKNEVGAQVDVAWSPHRYALGSNADFAPNLQARFGNIFTDATLGGVARLGSLNALPQQATNHLFLRTELRAVGYNAMLQGGYFSSGNVHVVKPKTWVGEVELGWLWQSGAYGAQAGIVGRGNEIRGMSNAVGSQNFARLQFSYTP